MSVDIESFRNHWKKFGGNDKKVIPEQSNPISYPLVENSDENLSIQQELNENHNVKNQVKRSRHPKKKKNTNTNSETGNDSVYEMELIRQYNGHTYDHFWTDNFSSGKDIGYMDKNLLRFGCSCCVGPCSSTERKKNWKEFFLSFTFWISLVELVLFYVEVGMGGLHMPPKGSNFFRSILSLFACDYHALLILGALYYPKIYCQYQIFRYITPSLLHGSIIHILMNFSFQFSIMLSRERYWGRVRMAAMFVVAGIGASVWSIAFMPATLSIGASGSLMGVFGGFVVDVVRMWPKLDNNYRYYYAQRIIYLIVSSVVMTIFIANINYWAHIGGFVTGVLFGMIILQRNMIVRAVGLLLLLTMFTVPTVLSYLFHIPNCT